MLEDEIRVGESSNIEFKVEIPKKSEKYVKSIVAFANTAGGMFSSCREYGIREPELLEIGDSFRVNLYRPSYSEVHQSSPKGSLKSSPKTVNQTQQKIIEMILEEPRVTQAAMAEKLGVTSRAVKKV